MDFNVIRLRSLLIDLDKTNQAKEKAIIFNKILKVIEEMKWNKIYNNIETTDN